MRKTITPCLVLCGWQFNLLSCNRFVFKCACASYVILFWVTSLSAGQFNNDDPDLFTGDILQVAIPLAGLAYSWSLDDDEGMRQLFKSTGSTMLSTLVLKSTFNSTAWGERPNGGQHSFPSGHTASACSGAFYLADRYGWQYGTPGFAAAAFVGYSRVDEGMHHWRDVVAGCVLAGAVSHYFVTPQTQKSVMWVPQLSTDMLGMSWVMDF